MKYFKNKKNRKVVDYIPQVCTCSLTYLRYVWRIFSILLTKKKEVRCMKNIKVRKAESANATAWWIVV